MQTSAAWYQGRIASWVWCALRNTIGFTFSSEAPVDLVHRLLDLRHQVAVFLYVDAARAPSSRR